MAHTIQLSASCLCGAIRQLIYPRDADPESHNFRVTEDSAQDVYLCHCRVCRKTSGVLWGCYWPCKKPVSFADGEELVKYVIESEQDHGGKKRTLKGTENRWFCRRCGGHVFREVKQQDGVEGLWGVATGMLDPVEGVDVVRFFGHAHVDETVDGGAAVWMEQASDGEEMQFFAGPGPDYYKGESSDQYRISKSYLLKQVERTILPPPISLSQQGKDVKKEILKASCHCSAVSFHITRPDATSRLPKSSFPDLIIPHHTHDPETQNPEDEKWWLRGVKGAERRYLAGTCACRSCRLASGFEIQAWVFVPRGNVIFHVSGDQNEVEVPLDFENEVLKRVLKSYESSDGVLREFCRKCGATVFWHDKWRPHLMDVSVGLLDAPGGVRAEEWLDWWTDRVSFGEDAAGHGRALVEALEKGMAAWGGPPKHETYEVESRPEVHISVT